jgi:hypothetical protein
MTSLPTAVLANRDALRAGFEHAIRIAMHEAIRRAAPRRPEEPDIICMLVLEGTRYLGRTLSAVLGNAGMSCTLASVFCHQRPEVRFNGGGCELGDVLFVHRHRSLDPERSTNSALLLQAKKSESSTYEISAGDLQQLRLYTQWPQFTYHRSGPMLNGIKRNIQPKSAHPGAQYLLIDDSSHDLARSGVLGLPGTYCMAVSPAQKLLLSHWSLADALIDFLVGLTGRPFLDDPSTDGSNWSAVVHDLLAHAKQHVFTRRRSGVSGASRRADIQWAASSEDGASRIVDDGAQWFEPTSGAGLLYEFVKLVKHFGESNNGDQPPGRGADDEGESGSVSVILIETHDGEAQ